MNTIETGQRSLESLLVANRGEIAVRIMRSAKSLGIRTVAVYSEADADAPHVRAADEAICIGPAPVGESYLVAEKILDAARISGASAVHPGYGFLSENADFAEACTGAGLVFVGPSAEAIRVMGNKAEAKRRMIAASVPCVPGYEDANQSDAAFLKAADTIGFPIMVKAAAGGGGRGMRLVADPSELGQAIALARSEAANAFGSGELILERAVLRPRHVEVQVFADGHGNVVHLAERDCSVQRRHQKVVEEAPCPVMTEELRSRMGAAAVEAARAINYCGAGTVEFLLDAEGNFYFLEMNTRLQVEHPVTEMITGRDLVALQIAVAEGAPLGFDQEDVTLTGHAIEVRLYAEDTTAGFLPSTGRVGLWQPCEAEGLRYDAGIQDGQEVSPFYDPMLAKVIAWGPNRETARRRLVAALSDTAVFGLRTNRDFLIRALDNPTFAGGQATTAFIDEEFSAEDLAEPTPTFAQLAVASVLSFMAGNQRAQALATACSAPLQVWSSSSRLVSRYRYAIGESVAGVAVRPVKDEAANAFSFDVSPEGDTPGEELRVRYVGATHNSGTVTLGERRSTLVWQLGGDGFVHFSLGGQTWSLRDLNAWSVGADDEAGGGRVLAPMHGALLEVCVGPGDAVTKGQRLAVLEAMKMQHEICAEVDGRVSEVAAEAGTQVGADDLLLTIEIEDGGEAGSGEPS